jgi:cellulose synthase/poly-beta-1,6-N-acetylglucosamine synthase-like glycosyltransferase
MILGLTIILAAFLFLDLLILLLFLFNFNKYELKTDDSMPRVSILLAAKDEEKSIVRCLDSLLLLSYPKDKLEILIGNDASIDNTLEIIKTYEQKDAHIKAFDITVKVGSQHGKANVLAQLANQAEGEYYLITDADMELPIDWCQYMLSSIKNKIGMAIGVTQVQGNRMQDLDWLYALGMLKVVADLGQPMTGMGNNMIISKQAYQSVGGYESLPFSITEDYELFKHVKEKGYQCAHIYQNEVLGKTLPIKGFLNLLNQRKRWMQGAVQLPFSMLLLLSLQPGFYIGMIVVLVLFPKIALLLLGVKLILRGSLMTVIRFSLNIPVRLLSVIFFEVYGFFLVITSVFYYLLPTKVRWKGRTY